MRGILIVSILITFASMEVHARRYELATGELQEKAQALADLAVKEGMQGALQFCAFKDGKCIVDVWAGTMTTNAGAAKIDGDTLFPIFSTEKPLLVTAAHRSVEQGKLEYDKPVSKYWPDFKGGGKERLTVRELLGYRSGLPDCKPGTGWHDFAIMADWKGMLEWYAACEPQIEPGTKQRYMPKSYGWALGGLLEKAWGRPANDILREQVLVPSGIEKDFYFVCGDDEIPRIATVYNGKAFESMNNDIARRSLLPSAWAVSSARGIAKFYNRLCGFDGKPPLIDKATLDAALKPCRHESDPLPDAEEMKKWHMIFGMGYGLWGESDNISRVFGHGGVGGSEGLCDRSQRLVIGYTCNFDNAPPKLREAFYSLVGMRWRYWKDDVNIQDLQMATVAKGNAASANSVASFCERAKKGDRLTVAFLGGSLSWGANATDPNKASWRALVGRRLEERYPDAHFKFIDAAIGGTDSGLGIFRLERDVMPCKPDIVFVEWLVNDGERKADDDCSCSYEGIVRHILERLPGCVPVQVMLPTRGTIEEPDASKLVRWDEQKRTGAAYGLVCADVLGEMRRRHAAGETDLDRMWPAWPALLGDTTHPHDYGYSVYADIIWDQIFAKPSDKSPTMPKDWLFAPKFRHVVRENVAAWKDLPKGWHNDVCYVRAGTFDFLCSRWQDGLAVAANCAFNPKTLKRELVPGDVEPLRAKFRGEVLKLYGESAEWSPKCEVFVDGKRVAERDTADFGRMFAPTAYLVWKIGVSFDANAEHTLEIRPVFADGKPQEFRLGSICVAGRNAAWVASAAAMPPRISVEGVADVALGGDGVVTVTSTGAVSFVRLKMKESLAPEVKVLNDAWERSYGDLQWQTLGEKTVYSPWYFLAEKDGKVQGFGVETGPGAMCCWEVSAKGVTLVLDVRAGGGPVRLNGRTLKACRIVRAESKAGESPWQFGRRFCRMMCPKPKLPKAPVYGYNDWYCAYGKNTATNFLADAEYIVSCAKGCANQPYVVMDDGWQKNSPPVVGESGRGPWDAAGANFGMEMPEFCRRIAALGAKPGLWFRPLRAWDELPEEQRLIADRNYLDPTVPAVQTRIVEDVRRFRDWGFKLVKIDFLSYDLAQIWPCDPLSYHDRYIQDDRKWRDDSRTTAEVMLDIYKAMKDAAGDDVVIIGCNAFNHLAAGVFELQRTGDDTSGKDWKRTRKNGVNTLAMRSIQDGAFFKIDADCVGLASEGAVPWNLNRQWMELLGRSGTPFFISWRRELATPEVREALSKAFRHASSVRDVAEPLDWFESRRPRRWRFADGAADFQWSNDFAARPAPRPALATRLAEGPEIIGIVHWGLNTYTDREWGFGDEDPSMLNPAKFDANQIVGACKAGGIGGLVVVAKHHDGFCLWPTKTTEHNITKTPFWKSWSPKLELENEKIPLSNSNSKLELKRETGRDYVKEMEQACRRAGLKFGVYCSPWDRNNAHYGTEKYVTDVFQRQLRELLSGDYGEIFEMWFDGANGGDGYYGGAREKRKIPDGYYRYGTETFAMVRRLQPNVCIFNEMDEADFRFGGNERGLVDPDSRSTIGHYDGVWDHYKLVANIGAADGTTFHPIEADFPLRKGWFYHESERGTTKSAAYLTKLYLSSVGNAATMNIGIAPNKDGLLDADDVKALSGFQTLKDALFAHEAKQGEPFNVVVMREDISKGEQVDEWEFVADGKAILRGKSIGVKRIRVLETPCTAKSCEVKVLKDGGALQGVSFKLYRADPELVRLVLSATTESGETDTARWMTARKSKPKMKSCAKYAIFACEDKNGISCSR